jgi:transcriptional regulator with XRE-family HTH domain
MSIGKKIKQMRLIHGWSQADLAKRAFIHSDTLQRIENDKQPAGPKVLRAIASAFDMQLEDLSSKSPEQAPTNFQERMQRLIDLSLMGLPQEVTTDPSQVPAPFEHKNREIRLQLHAAADIIKDLLIHQDEPARQRAQEFLRKLRL